MTYLGIDDQSEVGVGRLPLVSIDCELASPEPSSKAVVHVTNTMQALTSMMRRGATNSYDENSSGAVTMQ